MKSPDVKFRKNLLIPLFVALLVLLSGSVVYTYRLQQFDISEDVESHLEEVKQITLAHLSGNTQELSDVVNLIKNDKDLQKSWLVHERSDLLGRAESVFKKLYTEQKITHLYFINLKGVCFLRIHKPESYGDTIDRYTLKKAMREAVSTGGIELGPFGTLTLRVVHPWWIGGELKGYVEVGVDIELLVPSLEKIFGNRLLFTVDKSHLVREKWEEGQKFVGRTGDWNQFSDFVVANKMLGGISQELGKHIQFHTGHHDENVFSLATDDRKYKYGIGFVPLIDVGGRDIGNIIVLKDITRAESALHSRLLSIISASAFIGVMVFGFFFLFVGRIERGLERSHNDLKNEIAERKQVEAALQQARNKLEMRVQERTDDLKKANIQLIRELTERRKAEDEIRRLSQRLLNVIVF
jgi:C4-dicarboxylate-specific signal transduction histidine kinase